VSGQASTKRGTSDKPQRTGNFVSATLGLLGMALVMVGVLWFVGMQLAGWRASTALTFDPVKWAADQCRIDIPHGRRLTAAEERCFSKNLANASDEVGAPLRRLARWSLLPFLAGVMLIVLPITLLRPRPEPPVFRAPGHA
jgi:hypothetical protein